MCLSCPWHKTRLQLLYHVYYWYMLLVRILKYMIIHLNLSWPAVSQICSLTDFPPTFTTLLPNSTPMVWFESCLTGKRTENHPLMKQGTISECYHMIKPLNKHDKADISRYDTFPLSRPCFIQIHVPRGIMI